MRSEERGSEEESRPAVHSSFLTPHSSRAVLASPTQRQIWFLHQLGQSSDVYAIAYTLILAGATDVTALRTALTGVVARHAALRTTFDDDGGRLWQIVNPPAAVELPIADVSHLSGADRDAAVRDLAADHAREPFDFRRGPLFRARLVRLADDDHRLLLVWHHLILDGQSLAIVLRDLAALYAAAVAGRPVELPPAPAFADVCREVEAALAGRLPELLDHWTKKLTPLPPPVHLPGARPQPAAPTFRGAETPLDLSPTTAVAVAALARREGATPFTVLLAAFQALVHRLTGQDDFAIGAPVACRPRPGSEDVVGPLVNTIVLRADLSGEPTFADLLARTRRAVHDGLAHQELPFDVLVAELRADQDVLGARRADTRQPLFQVLFNYSPTPPAPAVPGATWTAIPTPTGTSKFALSLILDDGPAGLIGHIEYSTEVFDAAAIERLAGHFRTLLAAALADPGVPVSRLPLLTDAETRQVFHEWNATTVAHPAVPAHRLIAASGSRVAIRDGRRTLTYAELDRRANQLGRHLRHARRRAGRAGCDGAGAVGRLDRCRPGRVEGRWRLFAARPASPG